VATQLEMVYRFSDKFYFFPEVTCKNGKAMLDISADRTNETWHYKKINVRIKKPIEKAETISIITSSE